MNQSIKNGTPVEFDLKGMGFDWEYWDEDEDTNIEEYDGKVGVVTSLETFTELGDKDYEYYNVDFFGLPELQGVSGYHLETVETEGA